MACMMMGLWPLGCDPASDCDVDSQCPVNHWCERYFTEKPTNNSDGEYYGRCNDCGPKSMCTKEQASGCPIGDEAMLGKACEGKANNESSGAGVCEWDSVDFTNPGDLIVCR